MSPDPDDRTVGGAVVERLATEIDRLVPPGPARDALRATVVGAGEVFRTRPAHNLLPVHLPVVLTDGLVDDETGIGLAAACTAAYLGARLLDDAVDGHGPPATVGTPPGQEIVIGSGLLASVAPAIVAGLDRPSEVRLGVGEVLSTGLARLGDGQLRDIATFGQLATPDEALRIAEGKTGWLLATVARVGAVGGGLDLDQVEAAGRMGVAWGVARQLRLDGQKLVAGDARSVVNRSCGHAVAVHYASLDRHEDRVDFARLYARFAAHGADGEERTELVDRLTASGSLAQSLLSAEVYMAKAEAELARVLPGTRANAMIASLLEGRPPHGGEREG